jgi:hypothetical protein
MEKKFPSAHRSNYVREYFQRFKSAWVNLMGVGGKSNILGSGTSKFRYYYRGTLLS